MKSRFWVGLMLVATTNGPLSLVAPRAGVAVGGFVPIEHEVFAAETRPVEGRTVTLNTPIVIYGERIEQPVVHWYKRRLVWAIIVGLLAGAMLIEDDDDDDDAPIPSGSPPGSLIVTGPPL